MAKARKTAVQKRADWLLQQATAGGAERAEWNTIGTDANFTASKGPLHAYVSLYPYQDAYLISWVLEEGCERWLNPAVFSYVNEYHGAKATGCSRSIAGIADILAKGFAAITDGSAFA